MKNVIVLFLLFILYIQCNAQNSVFQCDRSLASVNKYIYELYIFPDSSSYLRGYYKDKSKYALFKGKILKIDSINYVFRFQPVVYFTQNENYHSDDTLRVFDNKIDTIFNNKISYFLNKKWKSIKVKSKWASLPIKLNQHENTIINTTYIDPITHKEIIIKAHKGSEIVLGYFSSKTKFHELKLLKTHPNVLTQFPDYDYFGDTNYFFQKE